LAIEKVKASKKNLRILHSFGHMLEPSEKIWLFSQRPENKKNMFLAILRKTNP
jgi:hypothetical protein